MTETKFTQTVREKPDNMEIDIIMWTIHLGNPLRLNGNLWINDSMREDGKEVSDTDLR